MTATLGRAQIWVNRDRVESSGTRALNAAADAQGVVWFPTISRDEPEGLQVVTSASYRDADVVLVFDRANLTDYKRRVEGLIINRAIHPGRVIVSDGHIKLAHIDLEFNNDIVFHGNSSEFKLPLGAIAREVKTWPHSGQLGFAVETEDTDSMDMGSLGASSEKYLFFKPDQIPDDLIIRGTASRHWQGLVAAIFMGMFMALMPIVVIASMITIVRRAVKQPKPELVAPPTTFTESQAAYEKTRKSLRFMPFLVPLFFLPMILMGNKGMNDAGNWMPQIIRDVMENINPLSVLKVFPVIMILITGVPALARWIAKRKAPVDSEAKSEPNPMRFMLWMLVPMCVFSFAAFFPGVMQKMPREYRTLLFMGTPLLMLPFIFISQLRASKKSTKLLDPSDDDYRATMMYAEQAGANVRKVQVSDSKAVNAFAGWGSTVTLTQGLRDKLTAEERKAVIAHEVGHVRFRHVPLLAVLTFALLGLSWYVASQIRLHFPDYRVVATMLEGPLAPLIIIPLLISPVRRKAEFAADTFALKTLGGFEPVAHSLAKIHLLNGQPADFSKVHAASASHPSLRRRLDVLAERARALGYVVGPTAVNDLINSMSIEPEDSVHNVVS